MAFVFRNERNSQYRKQSNPGPGSYQTKVQKQSKLPKAYVPFGSMEPKLKTFNENKGDMPGVGSYNIEAKTAGQKIIVSSQTEDIKIMQISRPNPVFKSATVRFKGQNQQESPGPGDYEINNAINRNKIYSVGGNNGKSRVIEHLMNLNKYQSIPSIPSNIHAFGYNDALQLNEPPVQLFKGDKGDSVGPGHYEHKVETTKVKALSWAKPSPKLNEPKEDSKANLGPGSYELNKTMQPLYTYKPSAQFASKTVRSMDQRKGHIPGTQAKVTPVAQIKQSRITQRSSQSRIFSQKEAASTHVGDDSSSDEDSIEYIEDTTPGPGAYDVSNVSTVKKFYPQRQKSTSFGVSSKRFVKKPTQTHLIGPGQYYQQIKPRVFKQKTIKRPKKQTKLPGLIEMSSNQPGPGSYEPRNTMEDKLIYKIQRGYRGQFGSTQARGREQQGGDQPGPGSYDPQHLEDQKSTSSVFKSSSIRKGISQPNQNPSPGAYNIVNGNIQTKVAQDEEEDPDLVIKKPGFGFGEQRFKEMKNIQEQDFEDDDIIKQIQEKYREQKRRKNLKPSAAFKDGQQRFNQNTHKVVPGPGAYYDGQQDRWNKRTYNILFADI